MNIVIWMIGGGILGWLGCALLKVNLGRGLVVSVIIGVVGAFFGGHVLAPIFGGAPGNTGDFNLFALLMASASAVGCLTISEMVYERFGM